MANPVQQGNVYSGGPGTGILTINGVGSGRSLVVCIGRESSASREYIINTNLDAGDFTLVADSRPSFGSFPQYIFVKHGVSAGNHSIDVAQVTGTSQQFFATVFEVENLDPLATPIASTFYDGVNDGDHYAGDVGEVDTTTATFMVAIGRISGSNSGTAATTGWTKATVGGNQQHFMTRESASGESDQRGNFTNSGTARFAYACMVAFPLASAGTDYDLVCDPVAYNASPTAASLLSFRRVNADTVGYNVAPTAANLLVSRRLTADPVTYSWTPTAANLLAARQVFADTVGYNWSPTNADLLRSYTLSVDPLGYFWTPSDATLVTVGDYDLVANTVPYGWTPSNANLLVSRRLIVDGVNYNHTPTAASLVVGRKIFVDSVSHSWTPTVANLLVARKLFSDTVGYSWSPTAASLLRAYRLNVDSLGYFWTPSDATLVAVGDYELIGNSVGYFATPSNANLIVTRLLNCDPVSYVWTPVSASLRADRKLFVDSVSYNSTLTAASLLANRRLGLDSVGYLWDPKSVSFLTQRRLNAETVPYLWSPGSANLIYFEGVIYESIRVDSVEGGVYQVLVEAGKYEISARTQE